MRNNIILDSERITMNILILQCVIFLLFFESITCNIRCIEVVKMLRLLTLRVFFGNKLDVLWGFK